jgi:hypothetical protein
MEDWGVFWAEMLLTDAETDGRGVDDGAKDAIIESLPVPADLVAQCHRCIHRLLRIVQQPLSLNPVRSSSSKSGCHHLVQERKATPEAGVGDRCSAVGMTWARQILQVYDECRILMRCRVCVTLCWARVVVALVDLSTELVVSRERHEETTASDWQFGLVLALQ